MVRILVIVCLAWLGISLAHNGGLAMLDIDDRVWWALLLPGVYLVGLVLLRD
ncbi:MAG TPA: hypothetical protein PK264_22920 [Hyphomicrobiaceae bacterium]|nr:hypothetical protein [Hyphomicrobiaceae bacterium]